MSEYVELVKESYAAFARRDLKEAFGAFDPEIEIEDHEKAFDTPSTYRGRAGMLEMIVGVNEGFEDVAYTPTDFTETEGGVLVEVRRTGRSVRGGPDLDENQFHLWDVEDGRLMRMRAFTDREAAERAASGD